MSIGLTITTFTELKETRVQWMLAQILVIIILTFGVEIDNNYIHECAKENYR